jgi:hypothetical protein
MVLGLICSPGKEKRMMATVTRRNITTALSP